MSADRGMLDFASSHMPALRAATTEARESGRLAGRRVGVALTLEPKTACLVEALVEAGARVAVLGSTFSSKPGVVQALREAGVRVFAEPGAGDARARELLDAFLDTHPELLADDGAVVTRHVHRHRRDVLDTLVGVAEETTSGVRPLRLMAKAGELAVACIAVNDARAKLEFDNVYGTGQSVVMAVLDTTNLQLQGRRVLVAGYGMVGRGIAATAHALGAQVTVTEVDPVRALRALHDGHDVGRLDDAIGDAEIVITATGVDATLTAGHFARMRDGAIIAVGGAGRPEVDTRGVNVGEQVRANVRAYHPAEDVTVYVLADGHCVNTTAGEGNPIEIMDLSLALQLRALERLAHGDLAAGVHLLDAEADERVAAAQLAARGVGIDVMSDAQKRATARW